MKERWRLVWVRKRKDKVQSGRKVRDGWVVERRAWYQPGHIWCTVGVISQPELVLLFPAAKPKLSKEVKCPSSTKNCYE
jgi:hypothetical protein